VTARLGFLYPGHAAEDDYPAMAGRLEIAVHVEVVHTSVGEDAHRVDALLDLGSSERLADGARELARRGVDAALWACTSGSFVFGLEGARRQAAAIADTVGVPASSTSLAFVRACQALGAHRVAVAATYPADVAGAFEWFLAEAGLEVVSVRAHDVVTAVEVGTFGPEWVHRLVTAGDHPDAAAVLVPDTALRAAGSVTDLERRLGKPVLVANQVTFWEALWLAGAFQRQPDLGRLFAINP
jgi:maleate cis-trans isomerase